MAGSEITISELGAVLYLRDEASGAVEKSLQAFSVPTKQVDAFNVAMGSLKGENLAVLTQGIAETTRSAADIFSDSVKSYERDGLLLEKTFDSAGIAAVEMGNRFEDQVIPLQSLVKANGNITIPTTAKVFPDQTLLANQMPYISNAKVLNTQLGAVKNNFRMPMLNIGLFALFLEILGIIALAFAGWLIGLIGMSVGFWHIGKQIYRGVKSDFIKRKKKLEDFKDKFKSMHIPFSGYANVAREFNSTYENTKKSLEPTLKGLDSSIEKWKKDIDTIKYVISQFVLIGKTFKELALFFVEYGKALVNIGKDFWNHIWPGGVELEVQQVYQLF